MITSSIENGHPTQDSNEVPIGPVFSSFTADVHHLQAPRVLNSSLALERKLPADIYVKVEYIRKRGIHGFAYDLSVPSTTNANFVLSNTRQDHYDGVQISGRHAFRNGHMVAASYVRSRTRSNQVLDFNIDNPQFSSQQPGPYPWDTPNRFLSYGLLPLVRGFDLAYSTEVHTGVPFNVVNAQQQLIGPPGSLRFPTWFTLNTHVEKRFHAFGYYWAIRGGFNNVTGRKNWIFVNNDIDSPDRFPPSASTTAGPSPGASAFSAANNDRKQASVRTVPFDFDQFSATRKF